MASTLFSDPVPHARRSDPKTSHAAAASLTQLKLTETRKTILAFLRDKGPSTDEDIADALIIEDGLGLPASPSGMRTRRSELVIMGLVKDSGYRKRLRSGRLGICWTAWEDKT